MVSLSDLIPLPNFGELLQSLLPDDDLRSDKYIRALGTRAIVFGLLGIVFFWVLAKVTVYAFPILTFGMASIFFLGLLVVCFAYLEGREYRDIDKEERQANADKTKAEADKEQAIADALKQDNHQRSTVQDRLSKREINYSDDEMDFTVNTTVEPEEDEGSEKNDTRELEYEE